MSEMNEVNETRKSRKGWFLGIGGAVLIAALAGGIAINANGDTNPDVAPSVVATAAASPSATPTVTGSPQPVSTLKGVREGIQDATQADKDRLLAAFYGKPLGIDLTEVFENRLADDVLTMFPEDTKKTKAGAASMLNTYQELVSTTNWVKARNGADDATRIMSFGAATDKTAAFDSEFMNKMKDRIAKEGQFAHIPTVAPDGTLNIDGVIYHTDDSSVMNSKSNQPAVSVGGVGETLHIEGRRYMTLSFTDGKTLIADRGYFIDGTAIGTNGEWLISNFGETYKKGTDTLKVVSDEEAAAWFAKAGTDG